MLITHFINIHAYIEYNIPSGFCVLSYRAFIWFLFVKADIIIKIFNISKLWNQSLKYLQGSEYSEDAHHDNCLPRMQSMETFLVIKKLPLYML